MSLIEKPYEGRATVEDTMLGFYKITIPAERKWFTTIFLCVWLCGWAAGEIFALTAISGSLMKSEAPQIFLIFWVSMWTIGGAMAISTLIWTIKGLEVITIGQGELSIERKGALFYKTKTYDINNIEHFRVEEAPANSRNNSFSDMYGVGTIRFDYGMKTIKFGAGLDEAEAKSILSKLADRKLIKYPAQYI